MEKLLSLSRFERINTNQLIPIANIFLNRCDVPSIWLKVPYDTTKNTQNILNFL